jgi:hypothetical protein
MQQRPERLLLNGIYFSCGIRESFWSKPAGATTESLVYKATYSLMQEVVNFTHTGKKVIQNFHRFRSLQTVFGSLRHHHNEHFIAPKY